MGLFNRPKNTTPPPPANENIPSQHTYAQVHQQQQHGLPIHNTGNTATTYTPTNEAPAPLYTPNQTYHGADGSYTDGIQSAPPPPAANAGVGYNEKGAAINNDPTLSQTQHDQQQQHIYPDHVQSQPQVHDQGHSGQYAQTDFHAQDKNQQANFNQQHHQSGNANFNHGQQHQAGRNNYQIAMPLRSLQQGPEAVDCPVCGVRELTRTEFTSGGTTHLSALLCCLCLCLGCIPYMATWFKDCEHYCGNCGSLLAVWHRSGHTEVFGKGKPGPAMNNGQQQRPLNGNGNAAAGPKY